MYERYEELLKKHNVTSYRVAKETGVSTSTFSDWKSGRSTPKQDKLEKIADFFQVTVDYLIGRTEEPAPLSEQDEAILDELEFALFGEVRDLGTEDKQELIRMARRMRELEELRKNQ